MKTKLTLTIDKVVIERAKYFARNSGRSLSAIVENYLDSITQDTVEEPVSPKLKNIIGSVGLPDDFDESKELLNYFQNKHGFKHPFCLIKEIAPMLSQPAPRLRDMK